VFAVTLTLITFPSSTGVIQDIFAQITPASLLNDSGNSTIDTTNSSGIIQLATLSSYQPITPASYSGGSSSNDNADSSNDNEAAEDDGPEAINYSDDDEDNSNYDDDNSNDDDYDNSNGNTIIITTTDNYYSEDDRGNSDYSKESENDGYYDDDEYTSGVSIGSGGAFASAGGGDSGGAFASVG
jgi:hypothetical protein